MKRLWRRAQDAAGLVTEGHGGELLHRVRQRLSSRGISYGLRRDLARPFPVPPAKIDLTIRPLGPQDDLSALQTDMELSGKAALTRRYERRLLASGLPTCWAAFTPDGKPCYLQWLIAAKDNDRIRGLWGNAFPTLGPDEALLEAAYTPEAYRGLGIMASAMARIAERAQDFGARYVITFVSDQNIPSLKGCRKAGFDTYTERELTWRLGRRSVRFTRVPEGFRLPYEAGAGPS
jgi:GNAT superfamily N-acetyltransferase